jgi:hypothetical protein
VESDLPEDEIPFNLSDADAAPIAPVSNAANNDLQTKIIVFSEKLARAKPLAVCDKGELAGVEVPACYGKYKGDTNCVRCPVRIPCLSN